MQTMTETADIVFLTYDLRLIIYINILSVYLHRCPLRSGSHGGLSILRMWVRVQVTAFF